MLYLFALIAIIFTLAISASVYAIRPPEELRRPEDIERDREGRDRGIGNGPDA